VPFLGGAEYSIADITNLTWLLSPAGVGVDLADFKR
jgi:hypothetical protein